MKSTIANPSIICAGFGRFDSHRYEKFKEDLNKAGVVTRELKILEFQIPVNEKYNNAVNLLKQNINPILKNYFQTAFPFRDLIFKQLSQKAKLTEFNYKDFEKHFVPSNLFKYGYLGLTPLFVDSKYLNPDIYNNLFDTQEEKENYKKLFSLESENYEPNITPTAKEEYFKND